MPIFLLYDLILWTPPEQGLSLVLYLASDLFVLACVHGFDRGYTTVLCSVFQMLQK